LYRSAFPPKTRKPFNAVRIPLAQLQRDSHNRWEGLIFVFTSGPRKPLIMNLRGIDFYNEASGRFLNQFKSQYYVYGGAERRKLKSVLIPSGTSLTYRIPFFRKAGGEKDDRIFFDGYLEKLHNDPMSFELIVNGEKLISQKVVKSNLPSYFKRSIRQDTKTLLMEIRVNGPSGNLCVLGNMKIIRNRDSYETYNLDKDPVEKHQVNAKGKLEEMIKSAGVFRNKIIKSAKRTPHRRKLPKKALERLKTLGYLN